MNMVLEVLNGQKHMFDRYGDDMLLSYGPAHIVYDDYNLDNNSIYFCVDTLIDMLCDTDRKNDIPIFDEWSDRDRVHCLLDIHWCLSLLLLIPEDQRFVYDDDETDFWDEE
jgi:hypothetical protein